MARAFVQLLERDGLLVRIRRPVSAEYEVAGVLAALQGRPVLFEQVRGSPLPVVGNLCSSRALLARALGISPAELIPRLLAALDHPVRPARVETAPFLERIAPDLRELPVLTHCAGDGGPFLTTAMVVARDPELGCNLSFHRMQVLDHRRLAVRIVPRHLDRFVERAGGELDVAVCVGGSAGVLLAAATSVSLGQDELDLAAALGPLSVCPSPCFGLPVPATTEILIEGRITRQHAAEGPFVDLTGTHDLIRQQPVLEVRQVSRRADAWYQALLPAGPEHLVLMGLPREPTLFREVNRVCRCLDVHLPPGGCSWLHAVVVIDKQTEEDGPRAIAAAFRGHSSLKRVVVVDPDIDPRQPDQVEWAVATRFQAERDLTLRREPGSSLDPSADPVTRETTRWGLDATRPLQVRGKEFRRASFPQVRLEEYLDPSDARHPGPPCS